MAQTGKQTFLSALTIALLAASLRCGMSCVGPLTAAFQAALAAAAP